MTYFTSLWKARMIEKCRREYGNEKINSILASNTEMESKSMIQRWRLYGRDTKTRLSGKLKRYFPDGSSLSNMYYYMRTNQRLPNYVLKGLVGFVGGIVLTYLCFIFFVFQLSISLVHATIVSSIIGVLLTLGLTFSNRIRCLVLLLVPQMFSRVGRYTLTCYALVLILTGPATNTFKNSEILSESMACSQEQIKTSVRQINESMKKPFSGMKESIKLMIDTMKKLSFKLNEIVMKINVLITSIADVIQSSLSWLNSVADSCTQIFGTPYDYCIKSVDRGVINCKKTLGVNLFWMCNASAAKSACKTVRQYSSFCFYADYATTSFAATLKRRLRIFMSRINRMLILDVKSQHTYTFSNATSSASQVAAGIVTEIRNRANPLLTWLSWSSCVTSLFLLLIIFRSRFDNRYVTQELRELDLKRYIEGRETVLPLNRREQAKYISVTSFRLVSSEKQYLSRSIVVMIITTFKLLIHIIADYSLYWVLMTIRYHGSLQTSVPPGPADAGVSISGRGIVADFIRSIFEALTIPLLPKAPSPVTCLPNPYPPNLQRYTQIAILIVLLWFFALFEPYGLRLRHVIMGQYRPERAKTRAVWLYNHILRTRASFMKLTRRKLHREFKYSNQEHLTFRHWINSILPFWILRYIFGTLPKDLHCLLCNTLEERSDLDTKLISCETPDCVGVYCTRCYSDIGCLCTICLAPADYGDMSDVSLEKGTSDDSSETEDDRNFNTQSGQLHRNENEETNSPSKNYDKTTKIKRKSSLQYDTNQSQEKVSLLPSDDIDDACFNNEDNFWYKMSINTFVISEFNIKINLILEQKQLHLQFHNSNKILCYEKYLNIIRGKWKFYTLNCKNHTNETGNNTKKNKGPKKTKFKKDKVLNPLNLTSDINKMTHNNNFNLKFKKRYRKKLNRKHGNNVRCYILKVLSRSYFLRNSTLLWKSSYKINIYGSKKSKKCLRISKINAKKLRNHQRKSAKEYINAKRRITNFQINIVNKYRSNKNNNKESRNTNNLTSNIEPVNNSGACKDNNFKNRQSFKKGFNNNKEGKEIENRRHCLKRMQKLCSLCSSCLISFKTKITSSEEILNTLKKKRYYFSKEKANFKRRKKRTEENKIEDGEKNRIAKEENVNTRNYRLFTYLLDQTWLKQDFLNKRLKRESALSDLAKLRLKAAYQQVKEAELNTVNSNIVNSKSKSSERGNPLKFDFERLSASIKSMKIKDVKLAISEHFLHLRIKNPLPMMRELYSTLLEVSSKKKKEKNEYKEKVTDADQEVARQTCTCGTQYIKTDKDKSCSCIQMGKDTEEFCDTADIDYSSMLTQSSVTLSTLSISDDTKTDTTVCSRVAIDYEVSPRRIKPKKHVRKIKINVVTKTNQGTLTDKAELCDVSTITSDWWSPIVERKFPNERLGRKEMYRNKKRRKLQNNDKSASTDGRIVTFISRPQIIPTDSGDILSPSRYLLESQKYYNELFSSKFYSTLAYPVNIKSLKNNEKHQPPKEFDRKGRKPKRLSERYSPHLKGNIYPS